MENFVTWLILIALAIVQSSPLVHLPFLSSVPELVFCFCIFLGTTYNWTRGFWWGIACGAVFSVFSLLDMRICIFIFAVCGLLAGSFRGALFVDHISTKLVILFFLTFIEMFLFSFFLRKSSILQQAFVFRDALKLSFLNCLFAVPLYVFFKKIYRSAEER